jgi:hypothetical protein
VGKRSDTNYFQLFQETAASNRYVRALKRLRKILMSAPGFSEE